MLLGFTALGGDEPLGGWGVPNRPETQFVVNRIFGLNVPLISPKCSVAINGDIMDLATPFSQDEFNRNQEFVSELMQGSTCNALSAQLFLDCFPDEVSIAAPKADEPRLVVPESRRMNAEFGAFGVATPSTTLTYLSGSIANVDWIVVDVIYV